MSFESEKRYLNKCVENLRFLLQRASLHSSINTGDLRTRNQKTGTGIICCLQRTSKAAENRACSVVLQLFFQRNATKSKLECIDCIKFRDFRQSELLTRKQKIARNSSTRILIPFSKTKQ